MNKFRFLILPAIFILLNTSAEAKKITILMFIGDSDSVIIYETIKSLNNNPNSGKFDVFFYTNNEVEQSKIDSKRVKNSDIILFDNMYSQLTEFLRKNADFNRTKVFTLKVSMRSEKDNKDDFIIDKKICSYFHPVTRYNITNLLLFLLNREAGIGVQYADPISQPDDGIFHPECDIIYQDYDDYLTWYKKSGRYKENGKWVGISDFSSYAHPGSVCEVNKYLIKRLEQRGFNVLPVYSYPCYTAVEKYLLDNEGNSRIDALAAFTFKFTAAADPKAVNVLTRLNVPVFNIVRLMFNTVDEWRASPQGLGLMAVSSAIYIPEYGGLIEPSAAGGRVEITDTLSGKKLYEYRPIKENIDFVIKRIEKWISLRYENNADKKVVIVIYNHTPGRQNIGASYLNVFKSISNILKNMKERGYTISGSVPSEKELQEMILRTGRNIGSWAPGELDDLIATDKIIRLPFLKYKSWYKSLNREFKTELEKDWGKIEDSFIMTKDANIILPIVKLGNVVIMPQPSRGWGDDPMKLYHSTEIYPHHQYTAFYLWLKHEFRADAMIQLGKHGTHEWLPGKQTALSQSCPPEVLIQDIPNIYPYIVDNIGEGTQAKRRGRGVIIDHLIPPLKKGGVYNEYRELAALFDEYNDAIQRELNLAKKKKERIINLIKELGIDKDLNMKEIDEDALEDIEHYIIEIQEKNVPYGMHTYGISPEGEALDEFANIIQERNADYTLDSIKNMIYRSGSDEMKSLLNALSGGYVPSGEGNDPLRNIDSLPTGRNFYGFDPAKTPSKEAYKLGAKAASDMIDKHLKEHGEYPEKIAIILWAVETNRNEGINESTVLNLLGMNPVWDMNGKVTDVIPIPGGELGRPRIDVHVQTSGLYRDSFPNLILLIDKAVKKAEALNDVDNFIAKHSKKIRDELLKKGYATKMAEIMSKTRVFSEKPGSYGARIDDLIGSSGLWESDAEIADVFIRNTSFGFSDGIWGESFQDAYEESLKDVDIAVHSNSSNVIGIMDNDDYYMYLGGLSMAVRRLTGKDPDVVISRQENVDTSRIEDIEKNIGEELRSRYLNPKWVEGMKKDNYSGARQMAKFVEYMWGWQVTSPFAIDETKWRQSFEVYINDKYDLGMKDFFNENNPWALQSISARMLEAVRKSYWNPSEDIKKKLSLEYAMNVIEKGIACCDHTCNNPALNEMVVNIISMYGLLSPELLAEFKAALSKATGRDLKKFVEERKELLNKLLDKKPVQIKSESKKQAIDDDYIEGYEIVEEKKEDSKISSSGSDWMIIVAVSFIIGLISVGWITKKY